MRHLADRIDARLGSHESTYSEKIGILWELDLR
jgi:hypothetical protein